MTYFVNNNELMQLAPYHQLDLCNGSIGKFFFREGAGRKNTSHGAVCSHKNWRMDLSGQIIATSHDLTPNGGLVREIPLFQGNLGW